MWSCVWSQQGRQRTTSPFLGQALAAVDVKIEVLRRDGLIGAVCPDRLDSCVEAAHQFGVLFAHSHAHARSKDLFVGQLGFDFTAGSPGAGEEVSECETIGDNGVDPACYEVLVMLVKRGVALDGG